jgi:CBS domain-containing protein
VGLVSRADALLWEVEGGHGQEVLSERVSDASLAVLHPNDVVTRAVDVMLETGQGRLPVVDPVSGTLIGLITRKDLLHVRAGVTRTESERRIFFSLDRKLAA